MGEFILNLLPLKENEKDWFEDAAPGAVHVYAGRYTVRQEDLEQATVIIGWPLRRDVRKAKNLRWLHTMWSGADEYLKRPMPVRSSLLLSSSRGANSQAVADYMLTSMLALFYRLELYRDHQRAHEWVDEGEIKTVPASEILVAGAGNVGRRFARLCRALGAKKIVGIKRSLGEELPEFDELHSMDYLDKALETADVVALTLPHSKETEGIINAARIARMKQDAVLLSCGRGSAVDENALVEALRSGKLFGAGMDVMQQEPLPEESPLWDIPNLILTPHIAGGIRSEDTRRRCIEICRENLRRYAGGLPLRNQIPVPLHNDEEELAMSDDFERV